MARVIVLDTGPLWLACGGRDQPKSGRIIAWLVEAEANGSLIAIPEIADYEVRREFIRTKARAKIKRLDELCRDYVYIRVNPMAMRRAARLWAKARARGRPTAGEGDIDGDVILAAQALGFVGLRDHLVIASGNAGHLSRYVGVAKPWEEITPWP